MTELERDELIVGIRFPVPGTPRGAAFHEVSVRYRDYAQVAAAALVGTDGSAELVMLCVADTPYHVEASAAIENEGALLDLLSAINPADDIGWQREVTLRLGPHPSLKDGRRRAVPTRRGSSPAVAFQWRGGPARSTRPKRRTVRA